MGEDGGATRDVARTYREALRREGKDLPAYNTALSVYLGHFPPAMMPHGRPWRRSSLRTSRVGIAATDCWRALPAVNQMAVSVWGQNQTFDMTCLSYLGTAIDAGAG